MKEAWREALTRAVTEVFENLCFMIAAPKGSVPPVPPEGVPRVALVVDFRGAGHGSLRLELPESMVPTVAGAMLGEDGPLEETEQHDAVRELGNIVCGNVLPLVAGERAVFDLSPPRLIAASEGLASDAHDVNVSVVLDEGLVFASLSMQLEEQQGAA